MKFLDLAKIYVRSGGGGGGAVSFRREKYIEYGGPDGGNGGRGGDVVAQAVEGLNTLIDFRYQQHFFAKSGQQGMGKQRSGKDGDDIVLRVPVGTEVLAEDQQTVIADMADLGQQVVICKGGNGGFGNLHFKSSTNQAPRHANPGQPGVERTIWVAAKADCRCRFAWPAQCGQINLSGGHIQCAAKDCRLSFHHAAPEPWCGGG